MTLVCVSQYALVFSGHLLNLQTAVLNCTCATQDNAAFIRCLWKVCCKFYSECKSWTMYMIARDTHKVFNDSHHGILSSPSSSSSSSSLFPARSLGSPYWWDFCTCDCLATVLVSTFWWGKFCRQIFLMLWLRCYVLTNTYWIPNLPPCLSKESFLRRYNDAPLANVPPYFPFLAVVWWFVCLLLLHSPAISPGFTILGWDFCVCDRFLIQPLR